MFSRRYYKACMIVVLRFLSPSYYKALRVAPSIMTSLIAVTFLAAHCCIVGWCEVMAATPIDRHATQRTQEMLGLLHTLSRDSHKVLFGQQVC